jgi:hypothetical protein
VKYVNKGYHKGKLNDNIKNDPTIKDNQKLIHIQHDNRVDNV